ncbi:hypothetical protein GSVR_07140 [Geobacter sp. SVR]|nr:hypothetical protein GSVR_07140 [Geobacter sp. SVR]
MGWSGIPADDQVCPSDGCLELVECQGRQDPDMGRLLRDLFRNGAFLLISLG